MTLVCSRRRVLAGVVTALALFVPGSAWSAPLSWKGYHWNVTNGGMAGVANGSPSNVTIDADGYLHLKITKSGNTWTASELFSTEKLGFGTYQWQIEGPIDTFDKNNVLGFFPYGPAAGIGADGTNEIDIEFSRWGQANGPNADFTDYPNSDKVIGETTFTFSLGGSTSSTARFIWTKTSIESSVLKGYQAIASEAELLKKWKYAPDNPSVNIPQQALPLGINLWCFDAPPSDGKDVEIVLRDFQFVKEGDPLPDAGPSDSGNGKDGAAEAGAGAAGSGGNGGGGGMSAGTDGGGGSGGAGFAGAPSEPSVDGSTGSEAGRAGGGLTSGAGDGGGAPGGGAGGNAENAGSTGSGTSAGSAGSGNIDDGAHGSASGCACRASSSRAPDLGWGSLVGLMLAALVRRSARRTRGALPEKRSGSKNLRHWC